MQLDNGSFCRDVQGAGQRGLGKPGVPSVLLYCIVEFRYYVLMDHDMTITPRNACFAAPRREDYVVPLIAGIGEELKISAGANRSGANRQLILFYAIVLISDLPSDTFSEIDRIRSVRGQPKGVSLITLVIFSRLQYTRMQNRLPDAAATTSNAVPCVCWAVGKLEEYTQ